MGKAASPRTGARRRASAVARRRPLQAAVPTQLSALKLSLDQLLADLRLVRGPVDDLCRLIAAVKKPLTLPATLETNLTDLRTLLQVVNTVASSASWLPAPAGPAAKAATTGLKLFLGPPKPGALTEMINTAHAVDQALQPARKTIEKIEKPANKVAAGLGKVDTTLVALAEMTDRLIARHGASPPPEIEACAARLNGVLAPIAQAIETLKREVATGIKTLADALRALLPALQAFSGAVQRLQAALAKLNPLRDALLKLKQVLSVVERVRKAGERAVKALLKQLGLDVNKIERWMNGILQQMNPFKPLKQALARLLAGLRRAIANLPGVDALLRMIDSIQELADRLQAALEDFLASECGKVFSGVAAR
jgi:ABC-type transporter Mla subunit MlaD